MLPALTRVKRAIGTAAGRPRRWRILKLLRSGGVGAEIGVFRGEFTPDLMRIAKPRELHLIDGWWALHGERFPDDWYFEGVPTRRAYEEALRSAPGAIAHVGDDRQILATFPDRFFDWVYLDSSHSYEHTRDELAILDRKVSGLIAGHDWHADPTHPHHGVCAAVREFCTESNWVLTALDSFSQWCLARSDLRD